jgi:hypothetical protein
MTTPELRAEFKAHADAMQPLNGRRKVIADEIKARKFTKNQFSHLSRKEKLRLLNDLKNELET